jgi:hypothetical protein
MRVALKNSQPLTISERKSDPNTQSGSPQSEADGRSESLLLTPARRDSVGHVKPIISSQHFLQVS